MSRRLPTLGACWTGLVLLFMLGPFVAVILVSLTTRDYLSLPDQGFTLKWYAALAAQPELARAAAQSLALAGASALAAVALGLPAAWGLAASRARWAGATRTLLMTPLFIPMILSGLAILAMSGAVGWTDRASRLWGAHVALTLPYVVRTLGASLAALDHAQLRAARNLGAAPLAAFWHVVLPQLRPGMAAAFVFAFIVSFDNVGMSLFLTGPGISTLPVSLYTYATYNNDPMVAAASVLMVLVSLLAVVLIERMIGVARLVRGR